MYIPIILWSFVIIQGRFSTKSETQIETAREIISYNQYTGSHISKKITVQPLTYPSGNFENHPTLVNNIFIEIFLNARDSGKKKMSKNDNARLGSKANPIVINQDFDKDTLKFIEGDSVADSSNIIEMKAVVSVDENIQHNITPAAFTNATTKNHSFHSQHLSTEEMVRMAEVNIADATNNITDRTTLADSKKKFSDELLEVIEEELKKKLFDQTKKAEMSIDLKNAENPKGFKISLTNETQQTSNQKSLVTLETFSTTSAKSLFDTSDAVLSIPESEKGTSPKTFIDEKIFITQPFLNDELSFNLSKIMSQNDMTTAKNNFFSDTFENTEQHVTTESRIFSEKTTNSTIKSDPYEKLSLPKDSVSSIVMNIPQIDIPTSTEHFFLTTHIIDLPEQSETIMSNCSLPNDSSDMAKADVIFLIDTLHYGQERYGKIVRFIIETIMNFDNIGPNGIQVSISQGNGNKYIEFPLNKHKCKSELIEEIANTMPSNNSFINDISLDKIMDTVFSEQEGSRRDTPKVVIIVANGAYDHKLQRPYAIIRKNNIEVLTISTIESDPGLIMHLIDNHQEASPDFSAVFNLPLSKRLANRIYNIAQVQSKKLMMKAPSQSESIISDMPNNESIIDIPIVQSATDDEFGDVETTSTIYAAIRMESYNGTSIKHHNEMRNMVNEVAASASITADDIQLLCSQDGFRFKLKMPREFQGFISINNMSTESNCSFEIKRDEKNKKINQTEMDSKRIIEFFVNDEECPLRKMHSKDPPGLNISALMTIHQKIQRSENKLFVLHCFFPDANQDLDIQIKNERNYGEEHISEVSFPTCSYTTHLNSPNGPLINSSSLEESLYHRWECSGDNSTNNAYGILINNCSVESTENANNFKIIDSEGCSMDENLFSKIMYDEEKLLASALSKVFTLIGTDQLRFRCKVLLCLKRFNGCLGITPPKCSANKSDLLAESTQGASILGLFLEVRADLKAYTSVPSEAQESISISDNNPSIWLKSIEKWIKSPLFWIFILSLLVAASLTAILIRFILRTNEDFTLPDSPSAANSFDNSHNYHETERIYENLAVARVQNHDKIPTDEKKNNLVEKTELSKNEPQKFTVDLGRCISSRTTLEESESQSVLQRMKNEENSSSANVIQNYTVELKPSSFC